MRGSVTVAASVLGICLATAASATQVPPGQNAAPRQTSGTSPATPGATVSDPAQPPTGGQPRPHNPAQEIAGRQPEGAALDVGPAKLRIGGYVGVTGIYRSTNSGGGPGTAFATIPYEDTLQGNVSETRLTAQSTRLSVRVDAPFPEARFRSLSGYFEMDFSGATPGTIAVTSTSAGLRLRQGFADVQYGSSFSLSAGQAFTLMTPAKRQLTIWPSDYEMTQAVDTNYVAGLVWARVPQVRLTWHPSSTFSWAVSVENPEQQIGNGLVALPVCCADDIAAQYNTGDQALSVPNLVPDVGTRVAFNPTPALHVDVGGVVRVFRHTIAPYDDVVRDVGGGVGVNASVSPARGTRLIGQIAFGSGLGRYLGGLAPDVAFRGDGSISSIPTTSFVGGLEQAVSSRVFAAGYYSGVWLDDTHFVDADGDAIGFGFPGSANASNRTITEVTGTVSYLAVRTDNRGSAQVNFQTSWLRRQPWPAGGGPASASAFLFFAQVRYNLP
jgi:hypothetical protein